MSCGLLLGRFMGFIREASIASTFGASSKSDVAILALAIPDVIINIIVAGGISAALIPEFKSLGSKLSGLLFLQVTVLSAIAFSGLALVFHLNPNWLVEVFAPGLVMDSFTLATGAMSEVVWLIPLTVLSGVTVAFLQSKESFLVPALGTFIFNGVIVLGFFFVISSTKDLSDLTRFVLFGGLIRLISQYAASAKHLSINRLFGTWLVSKSLLSRYFISIISFGTLSLFPVLMRAIASFGGEGEISKLNYSWRLVELPLGLIVAAVVVSSFPRLSASASSGDRKRFSRILNDGFFLSSLFACSAAAVVFTNAHFLVRLTYGWGGAMSVNDLSEIAKLLQIGILGLPFCAVIAMSSAGLNAQKRPGLISRSVIPGFVLLCGLSWIGYERYGLIGLYGSQVTVFILVASTLLNTVLKYIGGHRRGVSLSVIWPSALIVALSELMSILSIDAWLQAVLCALLAGSLVFSMLRDKFREGRSDEC